MKPLPRQEFFERWGDKRLHLKIGVATGQTLMRMAGLYKDEFFVGLEKNPISVAKAIRSAERRQLNNLVIRECEAMRFLKRLHWKPQFAAAHIYFPTPEYVERDGRMVRVQDPLVTRAFLDVLRDKMKVGGTVRILTDQQRYIESIYEAVNLEHWWPHEWEHFPCNQGKGEFIGTPCERQYRDEGREIYPLQMKRIS